MIEIYECNTTQGEIKKCLNKLVKQYKLEYMTQNKTKLPNNAGVTSPAEWLPNSLSYNINNSYIIHSTYH